MDDPRTLVSARWLKDHLDDPDLRLLDASWHMPSEGRDARAEYEGRHLPGARFFDIDEISDHRSDLPHMAPETEKFMSRVRKLGVGDGHQVVVYDTAGLFSAPRVWWLFKLMGHDDVAVLDGGLPAWEAAGGALEDMPPVIRDRHMTPSRRNQMIAGIPEVASASKLGHPQVVDVRSPGRFEGTEPEPRAALASGHVPGSLNLHYRDLLRPDGRMKDEAGLRAAFEGAGVDLSAPIITTCGSGVTAAILSLALARLGHRDNALYDGSWSEWGLAMPVETGPAR